MYNLGVAEGGDSLVGRAGSTPGTRPVCLRQERHEETRAQYCPRRAVRV